MTNWIYRLPGAPPTSDGDELAIAAREFLGDEIPYSEFLRRVLGIRTRQGNPEMGSEERGPQWTETKR